MSLFFLKDVLFHVNYYQPHQRLIFSVLFSLDLIVVLLTLILFFEIKRWQRIKDR